MVVNPAVPSDDSYPPTAFIVPSAVKSPLPKIESFVTSSFLNVTIASVSRIGCELGFAVSAAYAWKSKYGEALLACLPFRWFRCLCLRQPQPIGCQKIVCQFQIFLHTGFLNFLNLLTITTGMKSQRNGYGGIRLMPLLNPQF